MNGKQIGRPKKIVGLTCNLNVRLKRQTMDRLRQSATKKGHDSVSDLVRDLIESSLDDRLEVNERRDQPGQS
jgi:hypothetical protein